MEMAAQPEAKRELMNSDRRLQPTNKHAQADVETTDSCLTQSTLVGEATERRRQHCL